MLSRVREKREPVHMYLLAGLMICGLVLRLHRLETGLWYDEIVTLITSVRLPLSEMLTHFPGNNDHPLYSLMASFSVGLFGESAWAMRLPSVVFGVGAIPMVYLVGRRVTSQFEATLAAAIVTVSYHHIWFSQNARGYTMLTFAALLTTYLLLSWFEDHRISALVAYSVVAAIGSYAHLTMVFVVVTHALVCVIQLLRREDRGVADWKYLPMTFIGAALLTALLYAPMIPDMVRFFTTQTSSSGEIATPLWALLEAVRGLEIGFGTSWFLAAGGVIVFMGVWDFYRKKQLALMLFLLPIPVTAIMAVAMSRPIFPRFFFFAIGFGLLIAVRGAGVLGEFAGLYLIPRTGRQSGRIWSAGIFAVAAVVLSLAALPRGYRYPKQDFARAVEFAERNIGPRDAIAVVGETAATPVREYLGRPWRRVDTRSELSSLISESYSVWLLYTFPTYIEAENPALWAMMRDDCERQATFTGTVANGDVVVLSCLGPSP